MNKSFYISLLIAFVTISTCFAQVNLVPNPSFEEYDICPDNISHLNYASPWFSPSGGTPDYFNVCDNTGNAGVPANAIGYQYARTGNAYSGLVLTSIEEGTDTCCFEYISIELSEMLKKHKKYNLQLFVSIADSLDGIHNIRSTASAISPIGCLFTSETPHWNGRIIPPNVVSSESDSTILLIDSLGWQKINMDYVAKGDENYLTIGFFRPKAKIKYNHLVIDGSVESYYYIDDVSLIENGYNYPEKLVNLFTPNGDGINDVFYIDTSLAKKISVQVYNRWGNLVFESINKTMWDGNTRDGKPYSEGVYYYLVSFINEGEQRDYKGFIQLVR